MRACSKALAFKLAWEQDEEFPIFAALLTNLFRVGDWWQLLVIQDLYVTARYSLLYVFLDRRHVNTCGKFVIHGRQLIVLQKKDRSFMLVPNR